MATSPVRAVDPKVSTYLRKAGVYQEKPWPAFWASISDNHPAHADEVRRAFEARENGKEVPIYDISAQNLQLSLDITSQYWSDQYRNYLTEFLALGVPEPSAVLDIGCNNGVLTCFYARLFSRAEVVGVDRSNAAINCARELAAKMGLGNVRFENVPVELLSNTFSSGTFDVITSTCVLNEAIGFPLPQDPFRFLPLSCENFSVPVLNNVVALLKRETGVFVSLERCPSLSEVWYLAQCLSSAGISLDWASSRRISSHFDGEEETLSLLYGRRATAVAAGRPEDAVAFACLSDFKARPDCLVHENVLAEVLFTSLQPKQFIKGVELKYHSDSGTARIELWTCGALCMTYHYTDQRYRRLAIGPILEISAVAASLEEYCAAHSSHANVRRYTGVD